MADVSIDSSISTSTARGQRAVVFTTEAIGYWFYIDGDGTFGYSKTTNGGATWGAQVEISSQTTHLAFDVWFDQWTSGDTGTTIHLAYFDTSLDDIFYRSLDTNNDALGTQVTIEAETSAAAGVGVHCSITKGRGGKLYVAWECDVSAERGFERSTDGGATWAAAAAVEEAAGDVARLFPANLADPHDIWALFHDVSADALTLKTYDDSADTWAESATIVTLTENTTDLTGQYGWSASVRHSDGHLIVAVVTNRDLGAARHGVFDLTDGSTITTMTDIAASTDDHYYPAVFIDQLTDDLFVAYNGKRDGSEILGTTTKVYYTKSTDGGTSWSAGDTAYMEDAIGLLTVQTWAPLMGPRFYVGWRVGTTLLGNAVNSVVVSEPVVLADFRLENFKRVRAESGVSVTE